MSGTTDRNIAALLREREGYVLYGKPDRVEQVDADLKRRGYVAQSDDAPKERKTRAGKQSTADATPKVEG